jgi:hypothetical protein
MNLTPAQVRRLAKDVGLTASQLEDKYNPEGDGEHPIYTRDVWRQAVADEETISGYWDWLVYRITEVLESE